MMVIPSQRLTPFPKGRTDRMQTPALLAGRGFSLRSIVDEDLTWLHDLYATTRTEEMAPLPWPEIAKRSFLDQQFGLQHKHYMLHFGDADFLALAHSQRGPVGRYYLQRAAPDHLLVDISLFPDMRGQGIGHALIEASQREARMLDRGMQLHVSQHNQAAQRLYERLGFAITHSAESHRHMRWSPT
jgi:ribosomal protein S18 acetylase RimI-like enzyme